MSKDFKNLVYQGQEIHDIKKREALLDEVDKLTAELNKWKAIADNLYDEMRIRCLEHIARHTNESHDCMQDYENACEMEMEGNNEQLHG